jgi:hypothetical protein
MLFFAEGNGSYVLIAILAGIIGIIAVSISRSKTHRQFLGNILVPCVFIALAILFYVITLSFPEEEAGPAAVPHLWIVVLILLSLSILVQIFIGKSEPDQKSGRLDVLGGFIVSTVGYLITIQFLGYYIATFIFLVVIMYLLSYRKYPMIVAIAGGWLLFAYLVFQRMLYIPLPQGKLIEMVLE